MSSKKTKIQLIAEKEAVGDGPEGSENSSGKERRNNVLLRIFLDAIPNFGFSFDTENRIQQVLTGNRVSEARELEGRLLGDVVPKADARELEAALRKTFETGEVQQFDFIMSVMAGRRWYRVKSFLIFDDNQDKKNAVFLFQDVTNEKLAEGVLKYAQLELTQQRTEKENSENLFYSLIENSLQGIFIHDDHRFVYVNPAFADIFGYGSPEEVLKIGDVLHFYAPSEHSRMIAYFDERKSGGTPPVRYKFQGLHKDGSLIWLNIFAQVVTWKGKLSGLGTIDDISETRRVEEALQESQRLSQTVVDTIPAAVFVKNLDGSFKMVNPTLASRFGLEPGQVVGKHPAELGVEPEMEKSWADSDQLIISSGKPMFFPPERVSIKGQKTIWRQLSKAPLRDGEGNITGVVGVGIDITELMRAEEELKTSQRLLQAVFDTIPNQVFVKDANSTYLMANHRYIQRYGVDIVGVHTLDLPYGTEEEKQGFLREDQQILETGVRLDVPVLPVTLNDGSTAYFHSIKFPLRDKDQNIIGIVGSAVEITERVEAEKQREKIEQQLLQAQKMEAVGVLAGGVAHDFNNMLQIIHGYANRVLTHTDKEDIERDVQKILKASESAAELTKQLLAFSRNQPLQVKNVAVDGLIVNLMRMMERLLGEDIDLKVISGIGDRFVHGDHGMIEQVLMNLCVNARDAMPNGGKLVVQSHVLEADEAFCSINAWAKPGFFAVIEVTDTGVGMASDKLDRIFEPFFTTKDVGKGTGLGLSVVFGIIEQHQGHIVVYSEEGIGTTFKFYLPMAENGQPALKDAALKKAVGGSETILVAEDQPEVLELAVSILEDAGYTVLTAEDGEAACQTFENNAQSIDLVLLDVVMPRMSGSEALEKMRVINPSLRFLFSTGYSSQALDSDLSGDQTLTWIQKPYSPTLLLRSIREALKVA